MKDLDRMAMAAMQGIVSNFDDNYVLDNKYLAKYSYDIAEAMLEESKKRSNNDLTYEDD